MNFKRAYLPSFFTYMKKNAKINTVYHFTSKDQIREIMMSTKLNNPKDAVGIKKAPMSTVSSPFVLGIGLAMLEGARKYGRHNYREAGVRGSVYYDALMRHMMAWYEGQDTDPDSGLSHILKAGACLAVLYDSMVVNNWVDDRPPKLPDSWIQEYNRLAGEIIEKYPDCVPPITEV